MATSIAIGTRVLSARIFRAALSLCHDVKLAQVQLRSFSEQFAGFQMTVAEFAAQLQIPVFRELLRLRGAVFFGSGAPVLSCQIGRALPTGTVRALVDVNFATEDGVMLCRAAAPPASL